MKHQALARVFAIVLVIMSLIMLIAGHGMTGDAEKDRAAAQRHIDNTSEYLAEYERLLEENEGKTEYEQLSKDLEEKEQEHEQRSAEHRTDLAVYTATQGGIEMGIQAMDQADAQFAAVKAEYEAQVAALDAMEGAVNYAKGQFGALTVLGSPADGADGAERKANFLNTCSAALGTFDAAMGSLDAMQGVVGPDEYSAIIGGINSAVDLASVRAGMQAVYDSADATPEEMFMDEAVYGQLMSSYESCKAGFGYVGQAVASALSSFDPIIQQARAMLDEYGVKIAEGEDELYNARAQIWWQMGELEDQQLELATEKEELELSREELAALEEETRAQKEREQRLTSLRIIFRDLEGLEDLSLAPEDYPAVVSEYISGASVAAEEEYKGRMLSAILMMAGAAFGLLSFPAAFELIKKRFMLILPPVLCFLCAAAAQTLSILVERGMLYSVLGVLIFSLIHVLVVIPKKKV